MREALRLLCESILDKNNKDRLFDMVSLFTLIMNKNITDEELKELRKYINVKHV